MAEERSRKAAKGWLNGVSDETESLCSVPVAYRKGEWHIEASVALSELDKHLASLDDVHTSVVAVTDEDKLADDIQRSGTYRELVCKQRARLVAATQAEANTGSRSGAEVKMPKLNLNTFDGKVQLLYSAVVEKWVLFWESFQTCVQAVQ